MIKLAIFDLDGTLTNTISDLGEATNYALSCHNFPQHSLDEYKKMVGNGVDKLLFRALPQDFKNDKTVKLIKPDFIKYYDTHNTCHTKPYDGIVQLLEKLQQLKVKLAVASNKYQVATTSIVKHFFPQINWTTIEGQLNNRPVKPDPQIVKDILKKADISTKETLYIGDSAVDIITARNAGVKSIGVTWGFREAKELTDAGADYIVNSPREILAIARDFE